ncbi:integrase [Spiribacter halobius]|uniref:Integrase n=2 Tax=Sediminicurvatus halobius TaxID=2182432 RepID=A0A2U2N4U7_9GAMM|nr:integrase [Spiribacter halobius]
MDIPDRVVTREGHALNTAGDQWRVYLPTGAKTLHFERAQNDLLKWALMRFVLQYTQSVSSMEGFNSYRDVGLNVLSRQQEFGITPNIEPPELRERLRDLMQTIVVEARENRRLWAMYRPVRWYIWCADNIPEVGFCPTYANELDGIPIPGNPKGEAVRANDPEAGPLDRVYELPLLRRVLDDDNSQQWEHLQQKAALALSLAFGRNPANLVWLDEDDLSVELQEVPGLDPFYTLRIPRIKKRQRNPRGDFKVEPLDEPLAKHVQALVEANQQAQAVVQTDEGVVEVERPLFRRRRPQRAVVPIGNADTALRMDSSAMSAMLQRFVERHELVSPLTGEPMVITARRLRYTVATALVAEGISRRELAEFLDHTDTQHVEIYFDLKGEMVKYLDAAAEPHLANLIGFFKGRVVQSDADAVNGDRADKHLSYVNDEDPRDQIAIGVCGESALCNLDPPYSCYLCPKFQPYESADHGHVKECLLASRKTRLQRYENSRLGVQLDDVIMAVSSVISACSEKTAGGRRNG